MGDQQPLLPWTDEDAAAFGRRPHRAPHRLHESPAFTDEALAALLDRVPRSIVHPYTMGSDPAATHEWARGEQTDLPGRELLDVVASGRLWLNVVGISDHDPTIRRLVEDTYAQIAERVPGFETISIKATLLISSPEAQVYYHADNQPNLLWHLRGRKRAYVYPLSGRFLTDENLERLVAGASDEQLPYDRSFDEAATALDLDPGQVAWWPQNSPHRVENVEGLNVSLSTEHRTPASTRREHVWTANYYLRARGRTPKSTQEAGALASSKALAMRVGRKAGALSVPEMEAPRPSFVIDPSAPQGFQRTQ